MPYLILAVGIVILVFALYRFVMSASIPQIKALGLSIVLLAVGVATFILAVTGRLPLALALIGACAPLGMRYLKNKAKERDTNTIIEVQGEEIDLEDENKPND